MKPSPSNAGTPDDRATVEASSGQALMESAQAWARRAERSADGSLQAWLHCASDAYRALAADERTSADAAALATRAAAEVLSRVLHQHPDAWSPGRVRIGEVRFHVELRDVSPDLRPPLRIRRAQDVSMDAFDGERHSRPGFGVPVAVLPLRWDAEPLHRLAPRSGVFRNLTAWIEPDASQPDAAPRLVFADPLKLDALSIGAHRFPLARDTSAGYAWGMEVSKLERLGLWGLIGGRQIGQRAGLYLLEDYDPGKRPLVMIHGLGSNPLIWSRLSNAVWGADDLRARFQIWQVVYQTDAPLLVARLRLQDYLDAAWRELDPKGERKARAGTVLIGHSMGGVVSRLLCAHSGDALWNAAFLVPPASLRASAEDLALIQRIFSFHPYPGVSRAVFLAAPHRGSPSAATLPGRVTRDLVGRRAVEVHALRRIALANPEAIRPELRAVFEQGWINSITTLQAEQPVRRAAEALLPAPGIAYNTIAGVQPGRRMKSDGVVPLESALIPGAESSLVVESGHRVHEHPLAVAEVLRILRGAGAH
ncbi:alpha/beta hydrolase [Lysobacter sp. MMG2]|uniref:alpha/beta fold hydrolase n=1 Tax=Lysobacter sp. MMG2 TaxID=2801338 RepID=UPI001C2230FC|nr:alpha/beta fold hydrolase [Lysobacter sp. MMG2]MBU8977410.1 alpha/beta hydrolase [Lysobacter sp. MMG2]